MEQVPQIVRERLRTAARPENHPDPDLLAAFSEKALGPREHAKVVAHLAECPDCRNVVLLAIPDMERLATPSPALGKPRWSQWRVLRWGTVAASVVVVSAVLLVRERSEKSAYYSAKAPALPSKVEVAPLAEKQVAGLDGPAKNLEDRRTGAPARKDEALSSKLDGQAVGSGTPATRDAVVAGGLAGLKNQPASTPAAPADQMIAAAASPPAALPAKTSAVAAAREEAEKKEIAADKFEPVPAAAAPAVAQSSVASNEVSSEVARGKSKDEDLNQLKGSAQATEAGAASRSRLLFNLAKNNQASFRPSLDSWRVTPEGELMRSKDSGNTWQAIEVAQNAVIRAFCAWDSDIWAGGAGGALYYSSNSGDDWVPVRLSNRGRQLTSDITAINFSDANRGLLTTADNQIWVTSDGGLNWKAARSAKASSNKINKKP